MVLDNRQTINPPKILVKPDRPRYAEAEKSVKIMRIPFYTVLLAIGLGAFSCGCGTTAARIKRNADVFNGLPPDIQEKIRKGKVEIGYTKEMTYIALGDPDRRYLRSTADGDREVWAYVSVIVTQQRQLVKGPFRQRKASGEYETVYGQSIWVNVNQYREYEKLRIEFDDQGRIAAIDRLEG